MPSTYFLYRIHIDVMAIQNTINNKAKKKLIKNVAQKEYLIADKKNKIIGSGNFKVSNDQ